MIKDNMSRDIEFAIRGHAFETFVLVAISNEEALLRMKLKFLFVEWSKTRKHNTAKWVRLRVI